MVSICFYWTDLHFDQQMMSFFVCHTGVMWTAELYIALLDIMTLPTLFQHASCLQLSMNNLHIPVNFQLCAFPVDNVSSWHSLPGGHVFDGVV